MSDLSARLNDIKRELRDLKTCQKLPSTITAWKQSIAIPTVGDNDPRLNYTIYYYKEDDPEEPITLINHDAGVYLKPYNAANQTQNIRVDYTGGSSTIIITSNRRIIAVQSSSDPAPPDPVIPPAPEPPTPADEWTQYRNFNPANMGTKAGYCLQNCRLGFGIMTGQFPSARADMNSQRANGTLHTDLPPPANIAVPVYCESGTPNGHVVVWDHGKVYSDGKLIKKGLSAWTTVYGWGELCDGRRVVQHS